MLVGIITASDEAHIAAQVARYQSKVSVFELRLDFINSLEYERVQKVRSAFNTPVIFTLRSTSDGGQYRGDESTRLQRLLELLSFNPEYVDIESHVPDAFLTTVAQKHPSVKIIRSYHNFTQTPDDLSTIKAAMMHPSVSLYKLISTATSSLDVLRCLQFVHNDNKATPLVAHCMGEIGEPSRVLGAVVGNHWTYASLQEDQDAAPGVLSLDTLCEIYRLPSLTLSTTIYALLGDPVEQSVGHFFHNKYFFEHGVSAVYVKFRLKKTELSAFLHQCKSLPFHGFSVTMPLKEAIIPCLDHIDPAAQQAGAVNTLVLKDSAWYGCNTDGYGACQAIENVRPIAQQRILLIGAGGAAKAIACELMQRCPSELVIANRTYERAQKLPGIPCTLEQVKGPFDIIINTIPTDDNGQFFDVLRAVLERSVDKNAVFMDINYAKGQQAAEAFAKAVQCSLVPGYEMFEHQAVKQLVWWLDDCVLKSVSTTTL